MTDMPASDDARADQVYTRAAITGIIRHIAPGFWPLAIGVVLSVASWVLAAVGLLRLGVWGWLGVAYVLAAGVYTTVRMVKRKRRADQINRLPIRERQERTLAAYQALRARPRWRDLNRGFWHDLALYSVPKAAVGAYALLAWWPMPASVGVALVPVAWAFFSRLSRNDRLDPAMSMILTPRGPEGLPTPEI